MVPTPYQVVSQLKQPVQLSGNCRTNQEMLERNYGIRHDVFVYGKTLTISEPLDFAWLERSLTVAARLEVVSLDESLSGGWTTTVTAAIPKERHLFLAEL